MKESIIKLNGISKSYDKKLILDKIDLSVEENQSIAITGHNGCGKSTLLKIIAGIVCPSEVSVSYSRKLLFHYVPDRFPKMKFTVGQYLQRICEIDGIPSGMAKDRIQSLCEDFFLKNMLHTQLRYLSKGSLQKVGVIQALVTKPDVLLLDEPLSGQDIDSQKVFIQKIKELQGENVTIIMACHEQYLIDQICDTQYHIDDRKLSHIDDMAEKHITVGTAAERHGTHNFYLWFEDTGATGIPESYKTYMQMDRNTCKAIVPEKLCNQMILDMLQAGWKLRRMTGEDETAAAAKTDAMKGEDDR